MSSGGNRWLQFSNNGGRGRSREQIILISFSSFFKFRLLYHITSLVDVFNHSFWKLYIKTINDLVPGLILHEKLADFCVHRKTFVKYEYSFLLPTDS